MSALHVICKVADCEYAIPADYVIQMESYTPPTPVPGAPKYIKGLVQVRQQIIPLLDTRLRFEFPPIDPSADSRIVVIGFKNRHLGLLVDSAREVQSIDPEQFQEPPELVSTDSSGFIKSVAQIKDRIIMLLDIGKVIGQEVVHGAQ